MPVPGDGVSRVRSAARDVRRRSSIPLAAGCAPPNTRRAIRSTSSSVATASRRSSSVAAGSWSDAFRRSPRPRIPDVSGCSFSPPLSSNQMHPKLLEDTMIIILSIPKFWILEQVKFSSVLQAARSSSNLSQKSALNCVHFQQCAVCVPDRSRIRALRARAQFQERWSCRRAGRLTAPSTVISR